MFIDRVLVEVVAGNGGSGMAAFRRESRVPKGGPSGGDGGRGGNVYVTADAQLWTLLDYSYHPRWVADSGEPGGPSQQTGRSAGDLTLPVPPGTEVRDAVTGDLLGEVLRAGDSILVAQGGRGRLGKAHFATPTRQTPHHYQPGEDGEKRTIQLTLKLIADVGLMGCPTPARARSSPGGDRRPAQDRGLPLHHPRSPSSASCARRSPEPGHRRRAGPDHRGRARRHGPRRRVPAPRRAHPGAGVHGPARRAGPGRRVCDAAWRARAVLARAGREAALRRVDQGRPGERPGRTGVSRTPTAFAQFVIPPCRIGDSTSSSRRCGSGWSANARRSRRRRDGNGRRLRDPPPCAGRSALPQVAAGAPRSSQGPVRPRRPRSARPPAGGDRGTAPRPTTDRAWRTGPRRRPRRPAWWS